MGLVAPTHGSVGLRKMEPRLPVLLTRLIELREPLRGSVRAEFTGLSIPFAGEDRIRLGPDSAEPAKSVRVEGRAESQRSFGAAGLGSAPKQQPR